MGNAETSWLKVSYILSKLDLSFLANLDRGNAIYSTESILKLYLFKRIKGISAYSKLIESLTEEDANNLRFCKDENNNILLPTKRTFNRFFHDKKEIIIKLDTIAEKILAIATQNNIVLDIELVKKEIRNKKDELIRKSQAVKETIRLVKKLIYPKVSIKINHNSKFTTKDLLDILVNTAYSHDFINNGCDTFFEQTSIKTPNPDTILYYFKKLNSINNIEGMFNNIFDFIFNFAKSNYNMLNKREFDIAIDVHKIPYYGKSITPDYTKGGKAEGIGTNNFFHFITCAIVVPGGRFTIGAIPMNAFDKLEDLVDRLLKRAKSKIKIRHCYMDRGFDRAEIINTLKRNNLKFIMPKVRSYTVKDWFDKSEDCKARVIKDFKIGDKATTNLVLVDDKDGIKRAFSTNIDISEQLAHYLFRFYKFRWGIETSYRQIDHDFLARTTSRNFHIRLFYFLFSVCLYNLWILINICVSLNVYGKLSEKPIITAKLFAIILYKIREEYIDPGG